MNKSKTVLSLVVAGLLATPVVFANDNEETRSSDTSKNPITGTVTETQKHQKKTTAGGKVSKKETTNTKKTKSDGSVEHKTEHDASVENE